MNNMNMGKDNVFLHDVDVPEVVREKMDAAFLTIQKESEKTMKKETERQTEKQIERQTEKQIKRQTEKQTRNTENKNIKRAGKRKAAGILATAACMITVAAAVSIAGRGGWKRAVIEEIEEETLSAENNAYNNTCDDMDRAMSAEENTFTLKIMAAELEKDKPIQLVSNDSLITEKQADSWMVEGIEGGGAAYCINVPFTCQGNNIKTVTYSINNGAFQVVQREGGSIIIDGKLYDGELNTGIIGGYDYDEESEECGFEIVLYQSFTLDYQRQSDKDTWINICNVRPDNGELESMIFGYNTLETKNAGIQKMLDNTIITCTVHYADGTSKSADILVDSCIMTRAEAGMEVKDDPDREEIFITFERK